MFTSPAHRRCLNIALLSFAIIALPTIAQATETPAAPTNADQVSATKQLPGDAFWAELVATLEAGDKERASELLQSVDPTALSSHELQALKAIKLLLNSTPSAPANPDKVSGGPTASPKYNLYGAFSARTRERFDRSTFESLDHISTLFTQGLVTGIAAVNTELFDGSGESIYIVPAITGLGYALFASLTLDDELSRGDIPLIDGVAVYLPSYSVLLASSIMWDDVEGDTYPLLYATTSIASLPLGYWLSTQFDPDPGDAQLVRDSVFWGGLMGWGSYLLFHPDDSPELGRGFPPTTLGASVVFGSLGYLISQQTEYSLERIRAASLGGYIGSVVGGLLSLAIGAENVKVVTGSLMLGSGLGLALGFAATEDLDAIPEGATVVEDNTATLNFAPAPIVYSTSHGEHAVAPGFLLSGHF